MEPSVQDLFWYDLRVISPPVVLLFGLMAWLHRRLIARSKRTSHGQPAVAKAPAVTTPSDTPVTARILCRKCAHANLAGSEFCERCGHNLYVLCRCCGATTTRSNDTCDHCGQRLRRRHLDPEDLGLLAVPSTRRRTNSPPNDLAAAALMFSLVGLLVGLAWLWPTLQDFGERILEDRLEAEQIQRNQEEAVEVQEILQQIQQQQQQESLLDKLHKGR